MNSYLKCSSFVIFQQRLIFQTAMLLFVSLFMLSPNHAAATTDHKGDPHYNEIGFFDMHVCNWPKRPLFFMALFSTTHFDDIKKIEIFDNNKNTLGELNLNVYRVVMLQKPKREKRVFLNQINVPKTSGSGWYSTKVYLKDGKILSAKDYVILHKMEIATGIQPAANTTLDTTPTTLSWNPVPGAKFYQVFINDIWGGKSLFSSDLLSEPKLKLPKGLLKPGGSYCWRIHARDMNENVLLGDFNHGSLTECFNLDIKQ